MKLLKIFCIFLAMSLLAIAGLRSHLRSEVPIEECNNLLSSVIYADYIQQLRTFLQAHPLCQEFKEAPDTNFNTMLKNLIMKLENPHREPREVHEYFVKEIRKMSELFLESGNQVRDEISRQLFDAMINWVFRGPDLNAAIQNYVYTYIEPLGNKDFLLYLEAKEKQLYEDPRFNGIHHESVVEDNFLHGNLPSVYFELPSGLKVVRMGRPISKRLGFPWLPPKVIPEFIYFIQQQPNHVYVNLAKRHGQEGRGTKRIEALEREYPGFYVITLDKNSDFYQQEKAYQSLNDSMQFKTLFLEKMRHKNGDFYWSRYLGDELWMLELQEILDGVHKKYFSEKLILSQTERKDFIELTYLAILDKIVEKCSPVSLNITCNQGMDRSPSLLVLWMAQKKAKSDNELAALLFGPPLFLHNRSSHPSRIQRFVSAAKRFPDE